MQKSAAEKTKKPPRATATPQRVRGYLSDLDFFAAGESSEALSSSRMARFLEAAMS